MGTEFARPSSAPELAAAPPLLELSGIVVEFGGQRALDDVSMAIRPGEIVGLVGANGAGKSTLGRLLVGEIPFGSYAGSFRHRGSEARFADARDAHRAGIVLIHQEGSGIDQLTVGENVMLTIEPTRRGFIDWGSLHDGARAALTNLGVDAESRTPLGQSGGVALMELVEVARSIARGAEVFVFDESTAALGADEVKTLLSRMRDLSASGAAIIFISHHLSEVLSVCDRIVVLRDGCKIVDAPRSTQTQASIIAAMLGGRDTAQATSIVPLQSVPRLEPLALRLRDWRIDRSDRSRVAVGPINIDVGKGEIHGIYGPLGSGKTELLHSIFGLAPPSDGSVWRNGIEIGRPTGPRASMMRGFALVSAERQKEGVVPELSVLDNILLGYRGSSREDGVWIVRHDGARRLCEQLVQDLGIKIDRLDQPVRTLSGGNQQKVLLARALVNQPDVLLLDEPTRGIDVGARMDVYRVVRMVASAGAAVIVTSLEEAEMLSLASRILVLREGRQVQVVDAATTNEHELMSLGAGAAAP